MAREGQTGRSPLLDSVRRAIQVRHYRVKTEKAYLHWIKRYILFHGKRHPLQLAEPDVASFLTHLAVRRRVSPSTQSQALNGLSFLYRAVLERPQEDVPGIVRPSQSQRVPTVLTVDEIAGILRELEGVYWLIACLLYGSGLRLMEALRLRVKDIDFDHRAIVVRDGKGRKDRVVTLPDELVAPLEGHLAGRKTVFERDIARGNGTVSLPYALGRKYPGAPTDWGWQYVFVVSNPSRDPRSGVVRRHHVGESSV